MNFKEMCAQKRTEKDRDIAATRAAWHWLDETLSVFQELPHIRLLTDGPNGIKVFRDNECIYKIKIETGILTPLPFNRRWRPAGDGKEYHVVASRYEVDESSSFHQIEKGVKGHKELRKAIQFWFAQIVVDNNWD
jgi:hypothetical protein